MGHTDSDTPSRKGDSPLFWDFTAASSVLSLYRPKILEECEESMERVQGGILKAVLDMEKPNSPAEILQAIASVAEGGNNQTFIDRVLENPEKLSALKKELDLNDLYRVKVFLAIDDVLAFSEKTKKSVGDAVYNRASPGLQARIDQGSIAKGLRRGAQVTPVVSLTQKAEAVCSFNAVSQIEVAMVLFAKSLDDPAGHGLSQNDVSNVYELSNEQVADFMEPFIAALNDVRREILLPYRREFANDSDTLLDEGSLGTLPLVERVDYIPL